MLRLHSVLVMTLHGRFTFKFEQDKHDTKYSIWCRVVFWNAWNRRKAILISIEAREVSITSYRPIIRISTSVLAVSFKSGRHSTPRQLSTRLRSSNILLQGFPCVELQPAKLLLGLGVLLFQFPQSVWSTSTAAIYIHAKATKKLIRSTWMPFFCLLSFLLLDCMRPDCIKSYTMMIFLHLKIIVPFERRQKKANCARWLGGSLPTPPQTSCI